MKQFLYTSVYVYVCGVRGSRHMNYTCNDCTFISLGFSALAHSERGLVVQKSRMEKCGGLKSIKSHSMF